MVKEELKNFIGGMNQDLDKTVLPKDSYLEASNFRIVTSEGLSSGALENIQGLKVIHDSWTGQTFNYNGADCIPSGHRICGSIRLRDYIIIFTTNNTGTTPNSGRSIIYKLSLNKSTEVISTIVVVYDDSLNNSTGTLNFSVDNRIKAVSRYETPNIQKVYWTDGYNRLRYIDIAKNNTTDGQPKNGGNYYISPDLLEFLPAIDLNKPSLVNMITGTLKPGTVQYAYQYFKNNGSETVFSPLSNTIHIVSKSDSLGYSTEYYGEKDPDITTNKGCEVEIELDNSDKYNKVRIVRLHYSYINAIPTITIVGELDINSTMPSINFKDTGSDILGEITLDEFNIDNTELFVCQDIEIKNNQLFAANITNDDILEVDDWDARAVRFRKYQVLDDSGTGATTTATDFEHALDCTLDRGLSDDTIVASIANMTDLVVAGRIISDITAISSTVAGASNAVEGTYSDNIGPGNSFSSIQTDTSFSDIVYSSATDTLTFTITKTTGDYFTNFVSLDEPSYLRSFVFTYDWYTEVDVIESDLDDTTTPITIDQPTDPSDPDDWDTAGWTDYIETHDGINDYNDTDNDFDSTKQYIYQSDGSTLGAEGPNIKIGFATESMLLDESNSNATYWVGAESTVTNKSYKSLASPFKSGMRSWQRDETYRLYVVFFDDRGRASIPKWICDLRMPSLHDTGNYSKLAYLDGTDIYTEMLYPTVYFKSFPTGVESAQILRVQRGANDRSILTQGMLVPVNSINFWPTTMDSNITSSCLVQKVISPEINITKNINYASTDYLEFVTDFDETANDSSGDYYYHKVKENNRRARTANERTNLDGIKYLTISQLEVSLEGATFTNFNTDGYGSSGLLVKHDNTSWTTNGVNYCLVNYKRNVFDSQYGGNTHNKRIGNTAIPCSDILTAISTTYTCYNGDTFINYISISNCIFDLTKNTGASSHQVIFFPVESSINCELQHGFSQHKDFVAGAQLAQEITGEWENGSGITYIQAEPMYQYNTVYSQDSTAKYYINISTENTTETEFDCLVKVSNIKYNGEVSDSWTKFGTNEFIEVNSEYGEIKALHNFNDKLLFWQEDAMGVLSVNERSLIQDNLTSKLALGTGGVLERYDYISTKVGINNKFSLVRSQSGVYWYYDKDTSIYRFMEGIENVSKNKNMYSWFKNNYNSSYIVHGVYDRIFNEIIYTLYKPTDHTGYTISFNEQVDKFVSFYNFIPSMYIDYGDGYLSCKYVGSTALRDYMFIHNSRIKPRCMFYSFTLPAVADEVNTFDSEIQLLFNSDYTYTKVFDNMYYISNAYNNGIEIYDDTFSSFRAYNDYQNTHYTTLIYPTTIDRRERGWTLAIPRNAVDEDYTSSPDIFDTDNLDLDRATERMRDKYLTVELIYDNENGYKFVVPFVAIRYRVSYR